jgi:hypothetical protein
MRAPLPAVSEPVLPALPVSIPVLPAVSVHVAPAFAVPHPAGCSPFLKGKPTTQTRHTVNVPLQASTVVKWTSPLITTPKHKSIPNHHSIPNHNLKSKLKLTHPSQQLPTLPMPALPMSRFAYPNPFSSLQSDSSNSKGDEEDDPPIPPPYPRDSSGLPITTPLAFTFSLLSAMLCLARSYRSLSGTRCLTVVCVALVPVCPFAFLPPHCGLRMHRHLGPAV